MVRIDLGGRRVAGWVVADDVMPPEGVALRPLARVTGAGPSPELVALADWAAWRWAGQPRSFLRTASPPRAVQSGRPRAPHAVVAPVGSLSLSLVRLAPAADVLPLVRAAAERGTTLVVMPSIAGAARLAERLRDEAVSVALVPERWAAASRGEADVVIGARSAAWAPAPGLAAVVVVDEHDEALQEESAPTWHAREVAAERARRAGVPCTWVSPCPSVDALARASPAVPSRADERAGWPVVDVVDRRHEDPLRADLYSTRLVDLVRSGRRVVCVLNHKGRARLLACASCRELARCEVCGAAVGTSDAGLTCPRCGTSRAAICLVDGGTRLKVLRLGVSRARDDLERLAGVPVAEVTGEVGGRPGAEVLVGTEAVLHRVDRADAVAFLDLDNELLAPRYRAVEEAMTLVARAARLVGGRAGGGRLLLQTRLPRHEVVQAALLADPGRVAEAEQDRRQALRLPPAVAAATLSGASAEAYAATLRRRPGLEVLGPVEGTWLARAGDHQALCDALAAVPRPPGRLRVAVDPRRI